jgi:hypothetical protein
MRAERSQCEQAVSWVDFFFDENNIMNSLQTLLKDSGQTLNDMVTLCTIMLNSELVPALTSEGLMPFANQYAYVIPYARMTKKQLKHLRVHFESDKPQLRNLYFARENNFYYVRTSTESVRLDASILLTAAVRLMRKALVTSHVNVSGHNFACNLDSKDCEWYIDNALFKIVNSCRLQPCTLQQVAQNLKASSNTQA